MNRLKNFPVAACMLVLGILLNSACRKVIYVPDETAIARNLDDWTEATHSNSADPNYDIVFDQTKVQRIDIVLTEDEYQEMQDNLEHILGQTSGGPGQMTFSEETPVYVAADFFFNGKQWYDVGVRYKGNSSLHASYSEDIGKLPLRFKFDHFEDDFPEILNQRFYGFKEVSMSSNFNDESFMREKAGSDVFRAFGVPAARSAYYEIYLDHGNGPEYMGLYTMLEIVFDTMLDDIFGSNSGNCYKPDGDGAKFAASDFNLADFEKKTNETEGDWSDIQELYDALHSTTRTTDVEAWKAQLESVFDVDGFLKYLAANNTIQNWDTYGNMTHNYFLYHDPADDLIKWIVWDNNEAFQTAGRSGPLSFEMSEVNDEWPLISYIKDVPEYRSIYDHYIQAFIDGPFAPSTMNAQYADYNEVIANSATAERSGFSFIDGPGDYSNAVTDIVSHCTARTNAAKAYLE